MKIQVTAISYDHPVGGGYADTVATLSDGRLAWINTQYSTVNVRHAADCAISKQTSCYPRAVCTCGAELSDSDKAELITDARANGKFGRAPQPTQPKPVTTPPIHCGAGYCYSCHSYCFGDCDNYQPSSSTLQQGLGER